MGDGPVRTAEAVLARLGVAADTAIPALAAVGLWSEEGPRPQAWPVVDAVSASCYPDLALAGVMRLADRNPEGFTRVCADEKLLQRLACVVAASEALAVLLTTSPGALDVLLGDLEPTTAETVRAAGRALLQATEDPVARSVALTRLQRHGLLRIAARDLVGLADTARVTCELADLAEGLLAAALDVVLVEREDGDVRLAVVGMGKLGGQELNYVSDVDVIFVADGDWAAGTRLAERLLRLLGTVTPDGRAYEVDTNLRPEGRDGPLVRSLDAYAAYYERWAKPWEFQALLKARPIAGDGEVGQRFTELVEPHLWPDRLEGRVVEEIQRLKGVVEGSRAVRRAGARQVKLAPGGLRDIEFAVQLLQLVHGRHDRSLRSPNTLAALAALAEGGYVDEGDANLFGDAYQFLRTVEHRLQLHRLRRTHTVPESAEERYRLARAAGFRDVRAATALAQFDREYARVRGYVRRLHEQLFYRPLLSRFAELSSSEQMAVADGDHRLAEHAARDRLASASR
jgi:glutamate-ammonia-ligase adenylyltransferase